LLLFSASVCRSAVFEGRVLNKEGQPVSYATVYIHELSIGVSADERGEFRIVLPKGEYTCEISSLGYKRDKFKLVIQTSQIVREITLEDEFYLLEDVYKKGNEEDRAYLIMRKAIAKAPYHKEQVKGYESEVYLKGTAMITKIPALLRLQAGKKRSSLVLNKLFVIETNSTISYIYPNSYTEKVEAFSSTIPAEINPGDVSALVKTSIYEKDFMGYLSPLAPNALKYYKFVYEGISNESGRIVNKIKIIPSNRGSKLLKGYIYIIDETWSVSYLELNTNNSGVSSDIKINYNEVVPQLFVPTSYSIETKISLMGLNANGRYYSSIKYINIKTEEVEDIGLNESPPPKDLTVEKIKEPVRKTKREERLEVKIDSGVARSIDTLARMRDTTYWAEVRKLPLREDELLSYKQADSLKEEFRKFEVDDSLKQITPATGNKTLDKIFFDNHIKLTKNFTIGYGGLTKVIGDFNFTDGYWLGQNFYLKFSFDNYSAITFTPSVYYSTYRKKILWSLDFSIAYSPFRLGKLSLNMGETSSDISNNSSVTRYVNSNASYFFGQNPIKLYNKRWLELKNELDLLTGLKLVTSVVATEGLPLENGELTSIFGKTPSPNKPLSIYGAQNQHYKSFYYTVLLSFTPEHYYKIKDGVKRYVRTRYPTFSLYNRASLITPAEDYSNYGMAAFSVEQNIGVSLYSSIYYQIDIGTFYNRKNINLTDFKHFRASSIGITGSGFSNSFLLLDNYKYSTPESWITAFFEFKSDYILLNRLPFLNSQLLYEALHLKSIWLPEKRALHSEIGYSFGLKQIIRCGLFIAIDGRKYGGYGVIAEIPLLSHF